MYGHPGMGMGMHPGMMFPGPLHNHPAWPLNVGAVVDDPTRNGAVPSGGYNPVEMRVQAPAMSMLFPHQAPPPHPSMHAGMMNHPGFMGHPGAMHPGMAQMYGGPGMGFGGQPMMGGGGSMQLPEAMPSSSEKKGPVRFGVTETMPRPDMSRGTSYGSRYSSANTTPAQTPGPYGMPPGSYPYPPAGYGYSSPSYPSSPGGGTASFPNTPNPNPYAWNQSYDARSDPFLMQSMGNALPTGGEDKEEPPAPAAKEARRVRQSWYGPAITK